MSDIRPGPSTDFIKDTRPDIALSGNNQDSSYLNNTLDYAPDGLLTNEYKDTAYSEDEEPWDWEEDEDTWDTDMMDTYGTSDLEQIKKQNMRAHRFAGGDVDNWQEMRGNIKQGMSGLGQSLMDFSQSSGEYEDSGMKGPYMYDKIG